MEILNKKNIKNALEHPFSFVIIFLLIILALANSFLVGCLLGAILAIPFAFFGKNTNPLISFFCSDSSWKMEGINFLSNLLGKHTLLIIILGLILWGLINHTSEGKKILSYLD